MSEFSQIQSLLGDKASYLLEHECKTIDKARLHLPSPSFVSDIWAPSDRNPQVLRSLQALFSHGRLAGTGYLSILPVDQGIEHSAGASFAKKSFRSITPASPRAGCRITRCTWWAAAPRTPP